LADHGEIPELIVVGITSTVRIRDFTQTDWATHWVGGGGANNFKKFLSSELIPEVERRFRANEFRILSGHSAGGQFVLYCLTSEPALFQAYVAIASSLDWDDRLPRRSLEQSFETTRELRAFLYVARADDSGAPLADFDGLVEVLRTKSPQGLRWHGAAYPDETHVSVPLLAQIDAMRRLYDGYRFHSDLVPKGLAFAEQHFRTVSDKVGSVIEVPEDVINELGYEALGDGKVADAIALFERNVEGHPQSANAFDSLADGLVKAGRWPDAVKASEQAAALAIEFDHPSRASFIERAKKMKEKSAEAEKAK
jgi:tetratricopeptide (TPR) repeat protein